MNEFSINLYYIIIPIFLIVGIVIGLFLYHFLFAKKITVNIQPFYDEKGLFKKTITAGYIREIYINGIPSPFIDKQIILKNEKIDIKNIEELSKIVLPKIEEALLPLLKKGIKTTIAKTIINKVLKNK